MLAPHLLINVREMKEVEEGLGGKRSSAAAVGRSSRGANRAGAEARNIAEMRLGEARGRSVGRSHSCGQELLHCRCDAEGGSPTPAISAVVSDRGPTRDFRSDQRTETLRKWDSGVLPTQLSRHALATCTIVAFGLTGQLNRRRERERMSA